MLERLRVYQGADQVDLFGPVRDPGFLERAVAAFRRWLFA